MKLLLKINLLTYNFLLSVAAVAVESIPLIWALCVKLWL